MNKTELSKKLLVLVGGKENIQSVVHCATRMRFKLYDRTKADKESIEKLEGVISVIENGGQFQVVIGNNVAYVYKEFLKVADLKEKAEAEKEDTKKENIFAKLMDVISAIFTPILGAMIGSGIIKGLLMVGTMFLGMSNTSGTYMILNAASNAVFYFLPVILAYTSAKKFNANIVIAMVVAGALVYPDMIAAYSSGEAIAFLGIPVVMINYSSSVIPIILSTWFLSKVERFLEKIIPDVIKSFMIPLFSLAVVVPVTYLVVGPVGNYLGLGVAGIYSFLYSLNPIVAGVILGGFYQTLVVFGIHWALGPIQINNVAVYGFDTITGMYLPAKYAQAGATLAIGLKAKDPHYKSSAITTAVTTAVFGITEPAVYGFTLKNKKAFYMASIAAAVGGGMAGAFGCAAGAYGISNTLTLPVFIGNGLGGMLLAIVTAFILSAVLTFLFACKQDSDQEERQKTEKTEETEKIEKTEDIKTEEKIYAPLKGNIISLNQVKDEMFASEAMGRTFAIEPAEGDVYAPCDGTVSALFTTGHAIGITTESGAELLIHIGINTVELNGKYFDTLTEQGAVVKKGQKLIHFDADGVRSEGYDVTTMIIVTNSDEVDLQESTKTENTDNEKILFTVKKK